MTEIVEQKILSRLQKAGFLHFSLKFSKKKSIWNVSAYYIYNVPSCLCKITIINMLVILAIISVTGNVHHTAFKLIK